MSVSYGKGAKAKATRLHSLLVRARGRCANCGESEYAKLQCAHVISRRYSATRTDEQAALCLCWRCHRKFTDWPNEWMSFVEREIGLDEYLRLKHKALAGAKVDWPAEVERLKGLLRAAA